MLTHMVMKNDPYTQAVADQLRAERAAANITLDALAASSGIPRATLNRYLRAERDVPMPSFLRIASALGVPAPTILARAQERFDQ